MTVYCRSTTCHSRPTSFRLALAQAADAGELRQLGREERVPQLPVPPTYSVDTPDDQPIDASDDSDLEAPLVRPNKKRAPDEEHGSFAPIRRGIRPRSARDPGGT